MEITFGCIKVEGKRELNLIVTCSASWKTLNKQTNCLCLFRIHWGGDKFKSILMPVSMHLCVIWCSLRYLKRKAYLPLLLKQKETLSGIESIIEWCDTEGALKTIYFHPMSWAELPPARSGPTWPCAPSRMRHPQLLRASFSTFTSYLLQQL